MQHVQKQIVIVGSGWAWLRCAIHLREHWVQDILLVWDRAFDDAHTTQARGGINAALHTMDPEDTAMVHAVDTFREWVELAHPDLVEMLADHAPDAIGDLLRRWADFHREDDGRLTQRFFGAHSYRRTVFSWDETGKEMIRVMSARAKELGIPYLEHTYVCDLISDWKTVTWVHAIDRNTDEEVHIAAEHVVFAIWGYSNVYWRSSSRNKENFGDGLGMALRAGATLWDIELIQFHPTGMLYPESKYGELVTEAVRGEWWLLINAQWERFMQTYDPIKLELSTRDVVARANFMEIQAGRGSERGWVFLDISHKSKEYILERLPKMHSMILEYNNVDISQEPVEIAPTTHYTMGGIWFDAQTMETGIQNFWVAGECTMWVHGANRLGGNSLMETMVFGKKVAEAILMRQENAEENKEDSKEESKEITHSDTSDARSSIVIWEWWLDLDETMEYVRKQVWELAGIVRVEDELLQLQDSLEQTRKAFLDKWITDQWSTYANTVWYNRLRSVIHLALLICKWALERKESRGAHYRSDYLDLDTSYAQNYLHQLIDGKIVSSWKKVPDMSERLAQWLEQFERTQNYGHSE